MLVVKSQQLYWMTSPSEDDWAFLQKARDLLNVLRQAILEPLDVDGHGRLSLLNYSLTGLKKELESREALESPFGCCAEDLLSETPEPLHDSHGWRFAYCHSQILPMGNVILLIFY